MIQQIIPAVLSARGRPGDALDNAVVANARRVAGRLKAQSPIVQEAVRANRLKAAAARYDLNDGEVAFFEDV